MDMMGLGPVGFLGVWGDLFRFFFFFLSSSNHTLLLVFWVERSNKNQGVGTDMRIDRFFFAASTLYS